MATSSETALLAATNSPSTEVMFDAHAVSITPHNTAHLRIRDSSEWVRKIN
ncbi:MAG: hypothetical protein NVS3B20_08410 [Polyangiales bacterium]